jgi:hypothetical protein
MDKTVGGLCREFQKKLTTDSTRKKAQQTAKYLS